MIKSPVDADEILKNTASESVKQGENLRATVRDLTLKALQTRELSLAQIKQVLKVVTEGVNLGAATTKFDTSQALADALQGMDDALLKAVQASRLALEQLTSQGRDFQKSYIQKAVDDLESMEDEFLKTVKQASSGASEKIKEQWGDVLKHAKISGTDTGAHVAETMEQFGHQMQAAMRAHRQAGFEAAHVLSQNFASLASGVLIGLSEAMERKGTTPAAPGHVSSRKAK